MEEKKDAQTTVPETTAANPQVDLLDKEPVVAAVESTPAPTAAAAVVAQPRKSWKFTIIAIVLVVVALLAVLFRLEKEGRVDTNIFGGFLASQEANRAIATVNGEKLTGEQLQTTVDQLIQAAAAQGLNPTDAAVQAEIQSQAMDMLVNTELLTQQAAAVGIAVSQEAVDARIVEIETAAGGAEALMARLAEFDVTREQLIEDVQSELTIQALLDQEVFTDATAAASEEEIQEVYNNALAQAGDQELPPLTEVRAAIEQQIAQTKEASALEAYLQGLRDGADIETN